MVSGYQGLGLTAVGFRVFPVSGFGVSGFRAARFRVSGLADLVRFRFEGVEMNTRTFGCGFGFYYKFKLDPCGRLSRLGSLFGYPK